MHPTLTIATRAALEAGKIILRSLERLDRVAVSTKQQKDFVTEIDLQAEQAIIRVLRKTFPGHGILAEESGLSVGGNDEYQWLIDPLDGTLNYLRGVPHYAVSLALRHNGRLEAGLIYDPVRQEIFSASRGDGALLNDRRIRVRNLTSLDDALLGTGFPVRQPRHMDAYLRTFSSLLGKCVDVRRAGSAALDLAYVACGRLDGFWEMGLQPWDIAAGALLVQEAGGLTGDFRGGHDFLSSGNICAGNPKIFKAMLQEIQPRLAGPIVE